MVPFSDAVMVATEFALKLDMVAVKLAEFAPAPTVTFGGMVTHSESSLRATTDPPAGAAAVSVTVQVELPGPLKLAGVQLKLES